MRTAHAWTMPSRMVWITLLATAGSLPSAKAQYNPALPDAKTRAHFIYHPKSKALLLFDGYSSAHLDSTQNKVWRWDGKTWTCLDAYGPGSRILNASALHGKTGHVYLVGGWGKGIVNDKKGDTWRFDGSRWTAVNTNDIGTHDHHQMVFADHINAFVVYGGFKGDFQPDTVTWLLKNGHFTALSLPGPGPRGNFGMAYDPSRKKVVLVGGKFPDAGPTADLWEFDGKQWVPIPIANIGRVSGLAMTYNPALRQVVIHGTNGETWGWNGKTMTKLATHGPVESGVALGYDAHRNVLAAYGGFGPGNTASSSLWELKNNAWRKILENGTWAQTGLNSYERMPDEAAVAFNRANRLLAEKKGPEAEQILLKAINAGVANRNLYEQLGRLQYQLGKYREGVKAYEKLVELQPQGRNFYDLARGCARINDADKAFAALYKAHENGYGTQEQLERENDLASLRTDGRYPALLQKLKQP